MLLLLIPSIPIIGWILIIILAFTGSNQTRKNYFRAMIAWVLLIIAIIVAIGLVVSFPVLVQDIKNWQANHHH